jgi:hypothetical protein
MALIVFAPGAAVAQPAAPPSITAAYEVAHDRFHYFFENPSTFGAGLVPHDFTQTYWGDNQWVVVTARYLIGGHAMESEVAATPGRTTRGDDIDRFFQPDGDLATSGTSGRVEMHSLRVRQAITLGTAAGLEWHTGFHYRRDHSAFDPRQTKTVSHTQPASTESFLIEGSETTISDVFEVRFGASQQWAPGRDWRVSAAVDVAPTTAARLTTILPIKYPGEEIVFTALVMTLNPTLSVSYGSRWPIVVTVAATQTFSYLKSRQYKRNSFTASIGLRRQLD